MVSTGHTLQGVFACGHLVHRFNQVAAAEGHPCAALPDEQVQQHRALVANLLSLNSVWVSAMERSQRFARRSWTASPRFCLKAKVKR